MNALILLLTNTNDLISWELRETLIKAALESSNFFIDHEYFVRPFNWRLAETGIHVQFAELPNPSLESAMSERESPKADHRFSPVPLNFSASTNSYTSDGPVDGLSVHERYYHPLSTMKEVVIAMEDPDGPIKRVYQPSPFSGYAGEVHYNLNAVKQKALDSFTMRKMKFLESFKFSSPVTYLMDVNRTNTKLYLDHVYRLTSANSIKLSHHKDILKFITECNSFEEIKTPEYDKVIRIVTKAQQSFAIDHLGVLREEAIVRERANLRDKAMLKEAEILRQAASWHEDVWQIAEILRERDRALR